MKNLLLALGFSPKENTQDIYAKKYPLCGAYELTVDFRNEKIEYGEKIEGWRSTTANFSQDENWVVLECIDRLLSKWYQPTDIMLEKKFTVGRGAAGGWLDILVKREWKAYIMIECKTWGREFDREWHNTQKKWWQLLSYLQQDRDTELLVLYASQLEKWKVIYKNEIIKVEEDYRQMASNTEDLYNRWNKFSKQNGIFEPWTRAYHFESKALTLSDLQDIRQEDSSFIFNRFLEILRHNAVSDKPNAFNKIFTLFLCKIKDEDRNPSDELDFQWKEGEDDEVSFQKRLSDLYRIGMNDFLKKEISDISDEYFNTKYGHISEKDRESILVEITKLRLQKNNEFAIKEVFDEETFYDNSRVLKEVVELLQNYRFRYAKKQPFLGDFFELLLTTGLKQESGQFFTPVPIARFISKSIPLEMIMKKKLATWATDELLPNIIDYAAGSGHFLTESMEELQNIISGLDLRVFPPSASRALKPWQHDNPFAWAHDYIYGVELDYRLVKTTKVGCYLHGDGIANVIHGDGLDSFTGGNYLGKLRKKIPGTQDNGQFDFVLANPPYSVSACKWNLKNKNADKDFELYKYLTDQSSQIESLFIERTKQLLTEWGIAAIILPSSILSNGGIYTRTREILLKYFEFVAITELGSGTFMATGTNTVILFLRRRSNTDFASIESSIANFFANHRDISIKTNFSKNTVIENPISKYISHVWRDISFDDYISLITGVSSEKISSHEITREYEKKLKYKDQKDWIHQVKELEKEKILYWLLTYGQEIVLVKSGDKQDEKSFLGYEFSSRKGDEGIHATKRGKQIDECTLLFHPGDAEHPERVNTYILDAFEGRHDRSVSENLSKYVSRATLVDMLTWDRVEFEKNISLSVKKKIKIEEVWGTNNLVFLPEIAKIQKGTSITKEKVTSWDIPVVAWGQEPAYFHNLANRSSNIITISASGAYSGFVNYFGIPIFASDCNTIQSKDESKISTKLIFWFLKSIQKEIYWLQKWQAQPHVYAEDLSNLKIPLPPLDIQEQIVREIEEVEKREAEMNKKIENWKHKIVDLFESWLQKNLTNYRLSDPDIFEVSIGKRLLKHEILAEGEVPVYSANVFEPFGYVNEYLIRDFSIPSVTWWIDGDWMVNYINPNKPFYPTDHCWVLRVKNNQVNEKFLAYVLEQEGEKVEFSRTKRASIEKIQGIKVSLPPFSEQQRIVAEIEKIETEIVGLESELVSVPAQKEAILKKYL